MFVLYRKILLAFICLVLLRRAEAQQYATPFLIQGSVNTDTGTFLLMPIAGSSFYSESYQPEATIKGGKFLFTGSLSQPSAFRLGLKFNGDWRYISGIFIVDSGEQRIVCNIDSAREVPVIYNNSMREAGSFISLERRINNRDSLLLEFVKLHPSSYVGFWQLVINSSGEFHPIWRAIYDEFSDSLKTSAVGLALKQKLDQQSNLVLGATFPEFNLLDRHLKKHLITRALSGSRYTLIDFWFSHCGPCISQFSSLKNTYRSFKNKGFQLIAVSVDREGDDKAWREAINKYRLPWKQYWDVNGQQSSRLFIDAFPTNFLVNWRGGIIAIDINPLELNAFLRLNCQ